MTFRSWGFGYAYRTPTVKAYRTTDANLVPGRGRQLHGRSHTGRPTGSLRTANSGMTPFGRVRGTGRSSPKDSTRTRTRRPVWLVPLRPSRTGKSGPLWHVLRRSSGAGVPGVHMLPVDQREGHTGRSERRFWGGGTLGGSLLGDWASAYRTSSAGEGGSTQRETTPTNEGRFRWREVPSRSLRALPFGCVDDTRMPRVGAESD